MNLSELNNGDIISNSDWEQIQIEMDNCFRFATHPNYETNLMDVQIQRCLVKQPKSEQYPYGRVYEVHNHDWIKFKVMMFNRRRILLLL